MSDDESGRRGATATRSPTRSARAASSTTRATSARPSPPGTGRAAPATTTASSSGSSQASAPTRSASVARTACNDPEIKVNAFNYYQCDHGLGHGLMLYTAYDLPNGAGLLPPAPDRVRPGRVQRRRLHGEPELVVRPAHEVAEQEEPALPLQQQARRAPRQALLLPPRHVAHPPQRRTATGRRRPTGAGRASEAGSTSASSPTVATSPATRAATRRG